MAWVAWVAARVGRFLGLLLLLREGHRQRLLERRQVGADLLGDLAERAPGAHAQGDAPGGLQPELLHLVQLLRSLDADLGHEPGAIGARVVLRAELEEYPGPPGGLRPIQDGEHALRLPFLFLHRVELIAHDLQGGGGLGCLALERQPVELAACRPGAAAKDLAQSNLLVHFRFGVFTPQPGKHLLSAQELLDWEVPTLAAQEPRATCAPGSPR